MNDEFVFEMMPKIDIHISVFLNWSSGRTGQAVGLVKELLKIQKIIFLKNLVQLSV